MSSWTEEYFKHAALNFGQALQGLRFLHTHPDIDRIARPGTLRHRLHALPLRLRRGANDLLFAVLPPRWHHTREELAVFAHAPVGLWFQAGFAPCGFGETGERLPPEDRVREARWDPRCRGD